MITEAEKRFNSDYHLVRMLFFARSTITVTKAKNWIRVKGQQAIKAAENEILSDWLKKQLSRQSPFEKEEMKYIHEEEGYDREDEQ